ncbi:COG1361 family protein [Nakamurella leprariae]|uniref:DUF916 domain-containing protein n=1 Tax=Nakamurella leprariae TaxID=2803911 RepID=A0A938YGJ0_9ACTN|nr:hypothetical protein [Nakamurella leprariae]MBM9469183.1 hypothetical protein [Nakamurella leprariae]
MRGRVRPLAALVALVLGSLLLAPGLSGATGPAAGPVAAAPTGGPGTEPSGDAAGSSGSFGIRLAEVPAAAADDPRARVYLIDHLAPGASITRRVEVSNSTTTEQTIALAPGGARVVDGRFTPDDAPDGQASEQLVSWMRLEPSAVTVPAGGRADAQLTIDVPTDAPPGEQYAAAWASITSASTADGGVATTNRVGVRVYLSVGPGGAPASDFTVDTLTAERGTDGRPAVTAAVHNTGGRALDLQGTVSLSDGPAGLSAGPFAITRATTLAPGETGTVTVPLDQGLPDGPWQAEVEVASGSLTRTAAATITFPQIGAAAPVAAEPVADSSGFLERNWGWLVAAAAVIVVLLVMVIVLLLRRRPAERADAPTREPVS